MLSQTVQIANLFTTPLLSELWSDAAQVNPVLRAVILERRGRVSSVSLSNVLGWQSDAEMAAWGGEAATRLRQHVLARCDEITADLGQTGSARRFRWVTNMWANVSQAGASNQTHSHPGAYWSAVYYVDDGYAGSDDRALGGELVFLDPRMPMVRAGMPDLRYRRPDGHGDNQESWLRPTSGRLVIFPSWLMHSVRPYHGDHERISIAINLTPRPLRAPAG